MRILLLGNSGQVGWEAQRTLASLGEVISADYPQVDFTRPRQVADFVAEVRPDVIYNAVAYTAVDKAENDTARVRLINATSVGVLAESAARLGAALIHYSTDYVYDGLKGSPYLETDETHPLNLYGQTKLEGDLAIQQVDCAYLILRTTWVYSMRTDRDSFVHKVLGWAAGRSSLRVVDDQVSSPTWARMLAEISALALARAGGIPISEWLRERRGVYNLAGGGSTSRLEWAKEILALRPPDHAVEVLPAKSSEFPTPALRPLTSVLDCARFTEVFGLQLPPWQAALKLAMAVEK